jgi:haloalkane dehalogenase
MSDLHINGSGSSSGAGCDASGPAARAYAGPPGHQLHFCAQGSGRPVLLLHQAPSSHAMWEAVIEPLARRGHRVIAPDLPGHGMSDPLDHMPSIADYAASIAGLATELGLDRYDLVGHHTGVAVALELAQREPERIGRIVGWGVPLMDEAGAARLAGERGPRYEETGRDVTGWWKALWGFAIEPQVLPRVAVRSMAEVLMTGPRRADAHNALGSLNLTPLLASVPVEMLALAGTGEMLRQETIAAAELSTRIRYRELGDNGFYVADEAPEPLAQTISEFLNGSAG